MMRALGSAAVRLRVPVATGDGVLRELGIAASAYQEVHLAPVVVRDLREVDGREAIEVLISPATLDSVTPAIGIRNGWTFLRGAEQVVYAERVFAVTDVSADRFAGVAYMYHITAVASIA